MQGAFDFTAKPVKPKPKPTPKPQVNQVPKSGETVEISYLIETIKGWKVIETWQGTGAQYAFINAECAKAAAKQMRREKKQPYADMTFYQAVGSSIKVEI